MNVAATLDAIDRAGAPLRELAAKADQIPPALRQQVGPYFQQAVGALAQLEAETARAVLAMAGRPLPAPDPAQVGSWPQAIKKCQTAGPILHMPLPDEYVRVAMGIEQRCRQLLVAVDEATKRAVNSAVAAPIGGRPVVPGQPQQAPQAPVQFQAPWQAPQAPPQQSQQPAGPANHKVFGFILLGLSTLATGGVAYAAHRAEKSGKFGQYTPDEIDKAAQDAQAWLDREAPGKQITLTRGPSGEITASVLKGRNRVARERGDDPRQVAQAALESAVREDDLALPVFGAEVIDPKDDDGEDETPVKVEKPAKAPPKAPAAPAAQPAANAG